MLTLILSRDATEHSVSLPGILFAAIELVHSVAHDSRKPLLGASRYLVVLPRITRYSTVEGVDCAPYMIDGFIGGTIRYSPTNLASRRSLGASALASFLFELTIGSCNNSNLLILAERKIPVSVPLVGCMLRS